VLPFCFVELSDFRVEHRIAVVKRQYENVGTTRRHRAAQGYSSRSFSPEGFVSELFYQQH
jgi:hypothetical protein